MIVAFFGPDGCGKSSVIDLVSRSLAKEFDIVEIRHFRPGILLKRGESGAANASDPHGAAVRGYFASAAKLIIFVLDYWIALKVYFRCTNLDSTLFLFDRYLHDMLVDPARFRYGGSEWLVSYATSHIVAPNLCFVLDAPAEVLYSRKQELDLQTLKGLRARYLALDERLAMVKVIDGTQALDVVAADICKIILEEQSRLRTNNA